MSAPASPSLAAERGPGTATQARSGALSEPSAPNEWARAAAAAGTSVASHGRAFLDAVAKHTGLPAVVVAALVLVVGWRLAKKWSSFVLELLFVVAVLFLLSRFGALHF